MKTKQIYSVNGNEFTLGKMSLWVAAAGRVNYIQKDETM